MAYPHDGHSPSQNGMEKQQTDADFDPESIVMGSSLTLPGPHPLFESDSNLMTSDGDFVTMTPVIPNDPADRPEICYSVCNDQSGASYLVFAGLQRVPPISEQHRQTDSSGKNGHRHTDRSPSERRFKCDQAGCERIYLTRKGLKRHMVVHSGVRNFPCQYCQQRFGRKDHLVQHETRCQKSHNRDCHSSASSYSLSGGTSLTTSSPQPTVQFATFKCEHAGCDRMFCSMKGVKQHMLFHTGQIAKRSPSERRFKCEHAGCERLFFDKNAAERHNKAEHTPARVFTCWYCRRLVKRKDNLVRHETICQKSYSERRFKCEHAGCERLFFDKNAAERHNKAEHNPARVFTCRYCRRPVKRKDNLVRHETRCQMSHNRDCHSSASSYSLSNSKEEGEGEGGEGEILGNSLCSNSDHDNNSSQIEVRSASHLNQDTCSSSFQSSSSSKQMTGQEAGTTRPIVCVLSGRQRQTGHHPHMLDPSTRACQETRYQNEPDGHDDDPEFQEKVVAVEKALLADMTDPQMAAAKRKAQRNLLMLIERPIPAPLPDCYAATAATSLDDFVDTYLKPYAEKKIREFNLKHNSCIEPDVRIFSDHDVIKGVTHDAVIYAFVYPSGRERAVYENNEFRSLCCGEPKTIPRTLMPFQIHLTTRTGALVTNATACCLDINQSKFSTYIGMTQDATTRAREHVRCSLTGPRGIFNHTSLQKPEMIILTKPFNRFTAGSILEVFLMTEKDANFQIVNPCVVVRSSFEDHEIPKEKLFAIDENGQTIPHPFREQDIFPVRLASTRRSAKRSKERHHMN